MEVQSEEQKGSRMAFNRKHYKVVVASDISKGSPRLMQSMST
jgi:hypothetical protein